MPRLVYATCEPDGNPHSTYIARLRLLKAIETRGTQVLDDLSDEPYKLYEKHRPLLKWDFDEEVVTADWRDGEGMKEIEEAVRACLAKHGLLTGWLFVVSILTLQKWVRDPIERWPECREHGKSPWWPYPQKPKREAYTEGERTFSFEVDCPDPTLFPYQDCNERKQLEEQIRTAFERAMKAHLDKLTQIPDGFVKVLDKDDDRAFEWIIRIRVNKLSEEDIYEKYAKTTWAESIKKAIRRAEKLLGFPSIKKRGGSRPGKRTRPEKEPDLKTAQNRN
jgi:hypothetical protein